MTFNTGPASLGAADIAPVTGRVTLFPAQIANLYTANSVYSLGRGPGGNFFNGSYDYFNLFFAATPAPAYSYTAVEEIGTLVPPKPVSVTFVYDYEEADEAPVLQVRDDGTIATADIPAAVREGYTFEGWYTEREGGQRVTGGRNGTVFAVDATVYARWTAVETPIATEIIVRRTSEVTANEICPCGADKMWQVTRVIQLYSNGDEVILSERYAAKIDTDGKLLDSCVHSFSWGIS